MAIKVLSLSLCLSFLIGTAGCAQGVPVNMGVEEGSMPQVAQVSSATPTPDIEPEDEMEPRPEGWREETHGQDAEPNYRIVFPQDKVNQITIRIDPQAWQAMQANMIELFGDPGTGGEGPRGAGEFPWPDNGERPQRMPEVPEGMPAPGEEGELPGEFMPPDGEHPERFVPPEGSRQAGGPVGGPRGGDMTPENPMWVTATIEFEGITWTHVGVRYKGNSSLTTSWRSGSAKLPLKLDFDEFEDAYPEIDNQRFYGFKQLSFANNVADSSYMRDAVTYNIMEAAGLVAPNTAYYEVLLDHGEGAVSLGLYTVVEVIDDTVIRQAFGEDDGNIYEAEGSAASLAEGTFDAIEASFQKENNENSGDWSDIEELYNVLHSEERTDNPPAWRANLESVLDVESFLEWLAISAVIQDWDTYGSMSHNYYLYNDPASGKLVWISWDHDRAMSQGMGGGRGGPGGNMSLDKESVGENWPLIRYLLDDPVYYEKYVGYVRITSNELFVPDLMADRYQELAALIAPYAAQEVGQDTFDAAVEQLTQITYGRAEAVKVFLDEQG